MKNVLKSTKPLQLSIVLEFFICNIVFVYKVIEIVQYFTFCDI